MQPRRQGLIPCDGLKMSFWLEDRGIKIRWIGCKADQRDGRFGKGGLFSTGGVDWNRKRKEEGENNWKLSKFDNRKCC